SLPCRRRYVGRRHEGVPPSRRKCHAVTATSSDSARSQFSNGSCPPSSDMKYARVAMSSYDGGTSDAAALLRRIAGLRTAGAFEVFVSVRFAGIRQLSLSTNERTVSRPFVPREAAPARS